MIHRTTRAALAAALALLALGACGKKPDFPLQPPGSTTPRLYPDPTLDPGHVPLPAGTERPAPARDPLALPQRPAEVPSPTDVLRPVQPEPTTPPGSDPPAIPPGAASPNPGR